MEQVTRLNAPQIVFFDLEVRSEVDLGKHGLHRYACDPSTKIIVISAWFADDKFGVWAPEWARAGLTTGIAEWLPEAWDEAYRSGSFFCAWNAQFDRIVMKEATLRAIDMHEEPTFRAPPIERTLCAMAQAENYGLPGRLEKAADALKVRVQKDPRGKRLIRILCNGHQPWEPDPQDVADFWAYAMKDTLAMKQVWDRCRKWTGPEWHDYHVLERINERGIPVDLEFAQAAVELAQHERAALDQELRDITGVKDITLSHSRKKTAWLHEQLEGTELESSMWTITTRQRKKVRTLSANRSVQNALRDRAEDLSERGTFADIIPTKKWTRIAAFLDVLDRGNGVASAKFTKMLDLHYEGRLYHQFRCSPTTTGRHAARGVQFDNILRAKLPKLEHLDDHPALWAIELICERSVEAIPILERAFRPPKKDREPINKILGKLLRPTIIAPEGRWLVWGDLSSAEARGLPWLAKAETYLDQFRRGEDVYCQAAVAIFNLPYDWKELEARVKAGDPDAKYHRLVGKVAVLALGYQGGMHALMAMARGYDLRLEPEFAERVKCAFREANKWLTRFWGKLDDAAWAAVEAPGRTFTAGRLRYMKLGRDLYCFLPCGRPIVYPDIRVEEIYKERFDSVIECITYRKVWGGGILRGEIYPGILCENATQGMATGSLLRDKLRILDERGYDVIAPKHDEAMLVSDQPETDAKALHDILVSTPVWAEGLPLEAEVEWGAFYGK